MNIIDTTKETPVLMQNSEGKNDEESSTSKHLVDENKKLANQVTELVKVNASWEKYVFDLKRDHEKHFNIIMQDLKDEKKKNEDYRLKEERQDAMLSETKTAEERIKSAEEQKNKAVEHAIAQTQKVDDLKLKLQAEKERIQELESKGKEAEKKCGYLDKAVINLRAQLEATQAQNRVYELEKNTKRRASQGTTQELETQIAVLQQQIVVFKEDFHSERKDREKAQGEVLKLKEILKTAKNTQSNSKKELYQRELEVNALKETRDHQEVTIERLEQENRDLRRKLDRPSTGDKYNIHVYGGSPLEESRRRVVLPTKSKSNYGFLTDEQKRQIRKHWPLFCNSLRTSGLVAQLFSEGVLTIHQKQEIDAKYTMNEKAEYLMSNILMKATQRDLRTFRTALINSNQEALAEYLPEPNEPKPHMNIEEPMDIAGGMPTTWICVLCTYENYLHRSTCEMCGNKKREYAIESAPLVARGVDQCDNHLLDLEEG